MNRRMVLAGLLLVAGCKPTAPSAPTTPSAGTSSAEVAAFFAKNAKAPGVNALPSGLQYKVLRSGPADGPHPGRGSTVKMNYDGSLLDGTVFDSTKRDGVPAVLELDGLIAGWREALPMMRPGDEWVLYVPPQLGYGDRPTGPIPPGSALVFRIELLGVLPGGVSGDLA